VFDTYLQLLVLTLHRVLSRCPTLGNEAASISNHSPRTASLNVSQDVEALLEYNGLDFCREKKKAFHATEK
jgi:hypothetical protein